jgi:hypothetical protein
MCIARIAVMDQHRRITEWATVVKIKEKLINMEEIVVEVMPTLMVMDQK